MPKYRKFSQEYRDEAVKLVIESTDRSLKLPGNWGSTKALWGTGWSSIVGSTR